MTKKRPSVNFFETVLIYALLRWVLSGTGPVLVTFCTKTAVFFVGSFLMSPPHCTNKAYSYSTSLKHKYCACFLLILHLRSVIDLFFFLL